MTDVSVVVVSWNTRELLLRALGSAAAEEAVSTELVVVDNASSDGSAAAVRARYPGAIVIENDRNVGFSRAANRGIQAGSGRHVLLLNSDARLEPGALAGLVAYLDAHLGVGACGPRVVAPDGRPQPYAFGDDPTPGSLLRRRLGRRSPYDWNDHETRAVDWVTGACLLVRRDALERSGLFDEEIFLYFEDVDLCLRLRRAGYAVHRVPSATAVHEGGASVAQSPASQDSYLRSLRRFYAVHYGPVRRAFLRIALLSRSTSS